MRLNRRVELDADDLAALTPEQIADRDRYSMQARVRAYLIIFAVILGILLPTVILLGRRVVDLTDSVNHATAQLDKGLDNGAKTRALECRLLLRSFPQQPLPAICRDPLVERYLLDPNVAGEPVTPTTERAEP